MKLFSIVIPVFRNDVLLEYCLDTLVRRAPRAAELIVVDDGSGPATAEVLRKFERIRVVRHEQTRGVTAALNTGAAAAAGDLLCFLNSDVIVGDGSIQALHEILASDPTAGAVGALLLFPHDSTIQHAGVAFDRWVLSHVYSRRVLDSVPFGTIEERQAVSAAFLGIRRNLYEAVGGFDETYRDGLEDIDLCLRCRERGFVNLFAPAVRGQHVESATRGPFKHIRRTYNYSIFFSRWHGRFEVDLPRYLRRSIESVTWPQRRLTRITVVNFCTTPNWPELIEQFLAVRALGTHAVHDFSGFLGESDSIDLYLRVPLALQRLPMPILFSVDHFEQLAANQHWMSERAEVDLVVDRHANVLLAASASVNGNATAKRGEAAR